MDLDDMFGAFDPSAASGSNQVKAKITQQEEPRNSSSARKKDKKSSRKRGREDDVGEVEKSLRKEKADKRTRRDD
jgi:hypothetical protein